MPLYQVRKSRCPKCNWYLRLAKAYPFKCSSCGRSRYLKSIPTSSICRRCAAKKHRDQNVPVSITDKITVTTNVAKRLESQATSDTWKDIPFTRTEAGQDTKQLLVFLFCVVSGFFVSHWIFREPSFGAGLFYFGWAFGLPYLFHRKIEHDLAPLRKERQDGIALRTRELAEERQKRYEEEQLFYSSPEWSRLRDLVIKEEGRVCVECQRDIKEDIDVTVDHIRPRSKYPDLALKRENLRVLCRQCNSRKKDREWADSSSL